MATRQPAGRPTGTTGKARVLNPQELTRLLKVIQGSHHPHAKRNCAIVLLSHYLGLRAKELAALKIADVLAHLDTLEIKKTLRLIASYTKGNKHRDIPLEHPLVIKTLKDYLGERQAHDGLTFHRNAPLFRSQKHSAFSPNSMARVLINLYAEAGFEDASSHSGRRSLITQLAYQGIDLNSIRQIAGHSNIATTQRYIEDNPHKIADILKAL